MFSEVDYWYYRYLAGFRSEHTSLMIEPVFLDEIKWVDVAYKNTHVYWDEKSLCVES